MLIYRRDVTGTEAGSDKTDNGGIVQVMVLSRRAVG